MKWIFSRRRTKPIEQLEDSLEALRSATESVSTSWRIARQMLDLAGVERHDAVYGLGSGDGRIPILAAQEFGCRAVEIERNCDLWHYSQQRVGDMELESQMNFQCMDVFHEDLRPATVVPLYLLSAVNGHLQWRMASHLRPGSRIVALDSAVPGWRPARTTRSISEGNVEYTIFLYRRPVLQAAPEVNRCDQLG